MQIETGVPAQDASSVFPGKDICVTVCPVAGCIYYLC